MIFIAIPEGWEFVRGESTGRMARAVSDSSALDFERAISSSMDIIRRSASAGCGVEVADEARIEEHDHLTNKEGQKIDLQLIVKEWLRNRRSGISPRNPFEKTLKDTSTGVTVILYMRKPPDTGAEFLRYLPSNNGKEPTKVAPDMVVGRSMQSKYASTGYTGILWHKYPEAPLRVERREELEEKSRRQREARRHLGPSPFAT